MATVVEQTNMVTWTVFPAIKKEEDRMGVYNVEDQILPTDGIVNMRTATMFILERRLPIYIQDQRNIWMITRKVEINL